MGHVFSTMFPCMFILKRIVQIDDNTKRIDEILEQNSYKGKRKLSETTTKISEMKEEIEEISKSIQILSLSIGDKFNNIELTVLENEDKIEDLYQDCEQKNTEIDTLNEQCENIKTKLDETYLNSKKFEKVESLQSQILNMGVDMSTVKESINKKTSEIKNELLIDISEIDSEMSNLKKKTSVLKDLIGTRSYKMVIGPSDGPKKVRIKFPNHYNTIPLLETWAENEEENFDEEHSDSYEFDTKVENLTNEKFDVTIKRLNKDESDTTKSWDKNVSLFWKVKMRL